MRRFDCIIRRLMKSEPECLACMMKQALNTARAASADPAHHEAILRRVAAIIPRLPLDTTPAAISRNVYSIASEVSRNPDPYAEQKRETNRLAMDVLPGIRKLVESAADPLNAALHAAVAGNIIDMGIGHKFDISRDIAAVMSTPFAIDATPEFRTELRPGRRLLYLGDNAGEIVFDTVLVKYLVDAGMDVTFTVKSGPIINDATMEDATAVGMTRLCRVIETGGADIGVDWTNVSEEFRQAYSQADAIIAKGHGNFETCDDQPGNTYFLLKAKCDIVAARLGVRLGDMVFTRKPAPATTGRNSQAA